MKKITIRTPRHDEYDIWCNVYRIYLDFYHTSLTEDELKKVWSWVGNNSASLHCYFAELDQNVVGLAHFREYMRPIKASKGIYLDDLIVLPKFRGYGIGYQLIEAIKTYAKENDISLVRCMTAHDNIKAMSLYDSIATKTAWVTYETVAK